MTKHGGRYYLQYGAPGTEFNVYANGTYVSRQSARPVHIRAVQSGRATSPADSSRAPARQHVSGRVRQLVEHRHAVDRLQLDLRAADRAVSRRRSSATARCASTRASATSRTTCRRAKVADPDESVHRLDAAVLPQAGDGIVDVGRVRRRERDRRKSAHLLGRGGEQAGRTLTSISARPKTVRAVQVNFADYKSGRYRRRAGHLYAIRAPVVARRPALAAAGRHRTGTPRPAQRLSRAAHARARALRPLRAWPCRRREPRDQRPARVRQRRRRRPARRGLKARRADERNDDHLAAGARRGRLQHAVGNAAGSLNLSYQLFADGDHARAARAHCRRQATGSRSRASTRTACRRSARSCPCIDG